ncbi:glycosyltransferase [Pseudomonas sp. YeP6b]|uniref:glycosyltransferase n=1 Tax=Pseudomonas sp. YeP6b TaxID=2861775 RepID=UPI0021DA9EB2|nr:glycosyltransferase [Pseudomonas sp. YeP6b]UXZ21266.1 glycosyltransferase [Pseudomonas sp. YeP6b]
MKKILAFSFFPAFVPPSNGGEVRLFNFYRSLSRYHHVTLLTSSHMGVVEEVIQHGPNFVERRIPKDSYFAHEWGLLESIGSGGDLSGPCLAACSKYVTPLHTAYLEEYQAADVIIHDSPFTASYDTFLGLDEKLRVYNSYNCESELYRLLHPEKKSVSIHKLIEGEEVKLLSLADCILYCGEADLDAFERMVPGVVAKSLFAPNGMLAQPLRLSKTVQKRTAIFIGSAHPPNVEAARFIVDTLAPQCPDIHFHIVGGCLPEGKYLANLTRHGFVDSSKKIELLSRAAIALNPMAGGSGSNIKVFDYLSIGLALLSTPVGVRGIELIHEDSYISADRANFTRLLKEWVGATDELKRVGEQGYRVAKTEYTWDVTVRRFVKHIDSLFEQKNCSDKYVLFLNDYDSFASVGGGATRTKGICAAVSEWSRIVFLCFSSDDKLTVRSEGERITVVAVPKTTDHWTELRRLNSLFHVSCDDIVAGEFSLSNNTLVLLYKALARSARSIVVEHPYLTALPLTYSDKFVYSSQNNETLLKTRLLQYHPEVSRLTNSVAMLERAAVMRAALVVAVSREDADSLVQGIETAGPVRVIRNGASKAALPEPVLLAKHQKTIKRQSAVFLGSAHMPNVDAARFIVEVLAPTCPDIEFHLIGSVCSAIGSLEQKNIKLWGILDEDDKAAVMQSCAIAINPMIEGSGSNVKLADYLGNGLYVVTTEFGQRGYPSVVEPHVRSVSLDEFSSAARDAIDALSHESVEVKVERKQMFDRFLSMQALAKDFVDLLRNFEVPKKRILFVTYRYVAPCLGGAEFMIENLLRSLDASDKFDIDLVAPEVSTISNNARFSEHYGFEAVTGAFVELKNTRFARFPVLERSANEISDEIRRAWSIQPEFERKVYQGLGDLLNRHALAWGWGNAESGGDGGIFRWAYTACALHLASHAQVVISGYAIDPITLVIQDGEGCLLFNSTVSGAFEVSCSAEAGQVEILSSKTKVSTADARPLAFMLLKVTVDGSELDLGSTLITSISNLSPRAGFNALANAADSVRRPMSINLTNMRGPFSSELESFLENSIHQYDLVITHNNIFRPAVVAIEHAGKNNVPSIMIPHAHLDDDFYHFPDVLDSALNATLVLAAPHAACDFYAERGAAVRYLPAGINVDERFTASDVTAFEDVYGIDGPFVLVLGRKAAAKGYRDVIDAVAAINKVTPLRVVLIGPDDDRLAVTSSCATYLGRQPRDVVRGALMSCVALVNMSVSESFGIVLLEAWLAGKPVIVNKGCAAFHDMAIDGENALMVTPSQLQYAIKKLVEDEPLRTKLSIAGRVTALKYSWREVGDGFLAECRLLTGI